MGTIMVAIICDLSQFNNTGTKFHVLSELRRNCGTK